MYRCPRRERDKNVVAQLKDTKRKFDTAYKSLREDTFTSTNIVITTCSNAADQELRSGYKPTVIIGDEMGQDQEVESLLAAIFNVDTVKLLVLIGDVKQLRPTVLTKGKRKPDDSMTNPFTDQIQLSYFARLRQLKYPAVMFLEQHRMVKGLSDPSSSIWYGGQLTDAPGTELARRPMTRWPANAFSFSGISIVLKRQCRVLC